MSAISDGRICLSNGKIRVGIQPDLGAGLTEMAAWHEGQWEDVLRPCRGPSEDPEQLACCLLMPWSNRLYGGGFQWRDQLVKVLPQRTVDHVPLHGDAWLAQWQVVGHGVEEVTLIHDARGAMPFPYVGQVRYWLKDSTLLIEMRVEHHGADPMLYGLGLHPWFLRSPDTQICFKSEGRLEPHATHPPREVRSLSGSESHSFHWAKALPNELIDHAYLGWNGRAELRWPARALKVLLQASTQAQYLVVYSPEGVAGANFVCLEPVTHAPDAHRSHEPMSSGLVELRSGGHLDLTVSLTVSSMRS